MSSSSVKLEPSSSTREAPSLLSSSLPASKPEQPKASPSQQTTQDKSTAPGSERSLQLTSFSKDLRADIAQTTKGQAAQPDTTSGPAGQTVLDLIMNWLARQLRRLVNLLVSPPARTQRPATPAQRTRGADGKALPAMPGHFEKEHSSERLAPNSVIEAIKSGRDLNSLVESGTIFVGPSLGGAPLDGPIVSSNDGDDSDEESRGK